MGAAHSASDSIYRTEPGYRQGVMSFFAQDDWRASSKLTLNLGVRWEIPTPRTEAFNRMAQFDPTAANPLPSGATIPGALVWLGSCPGCRNGSSFQDYYVKEWAPRLGLAYEINNKLVLRAGYGISYQPPTEGGWGAEQFFGFNSSVVVHRQSGPMNAVNPVMYLSNFASGSAPGQVGMPAFTGTLPNTNPASMNGNGVDYYPANSLAMPYIQNWSAGFQYQFPHEVLMEANYIGSKGTRLINYDMGGINQANAKYMGLGDILADDFGADLSNPTTAATLAQYGITKLPYPTFETDNPAFSSNSVATGLARFPQYSGVQNDSPGLGNSTYHSLQLTARKNSTHGLTFIGAYTLSKNISDSASAMRYYNAYIQDLYNRKLEKSIVSFDYPQVLKLTWIYALPFGHGQRWMHSSGWADRIFSGWQLTAIQRYGSGDPLAIYSAFDSSSAITPWVRPDVLSGVPKTLTPHGLNALLAYNAAGAVTNGTAWLNPAAFPDVPTSPNNGYPLRPGTAPPFLPNVRGPGHEVEDFGLIKNTRITERVRLELRADFQNVFNRTGLGDPDTYLTDGIPSQGGTFGLITAPMNGPRAIQMGMHITF